MNNQQDAEKRKRAILADMQQEFEERGVVGALCKAVIYGVLTEADISEIMVEVVEASSRGVTPHLIRMAIRSTYA